MHIDDLLRDIKPYIPFCSVNDAESFLSRYCPDDRIAFVSALYFGRDHLHHDRVSIEHEQLLFSGNMNRFWDQDLYTSDSVLARILYEKNSNLHDYYDAFLRCTHNSGYDRDHY